MSDQEIFDKLIQIMKKLFEGSKVFDYNSITLETKPIENLGFDSMDLIMMSFSIEQEFKIDISGLSVTSFLSIQNVINYIKSQMKA